MSLEAIIRPAQARDVFTARVLPPANPSPTNLSPVVIFWGDPISLISKSIGVNKLVGGVTRTEVSRKTSTVRITNPNDASQFVDVQRVDAIQMKDEYGQLYSWQFHNANGFQGNGQQ